ncbi:MAG: LPS-assembly protein LptD [Betaproteobacteria bacterium AqS2]|uniref:LPS-assembly protein LptD n=1 Tax=Candidatus Amphirhobacter heronislandensis TaxID=1732024 RepID=A0A930UGN8_9GAMM|nr:LPS-assembly protein LptD [Betaproteobacteria bacterium AqS2]
MLAAAPAARAQLGDIQLEADEIEGEAGTEMRAVGAVLRFRGVTLEAGELRFDSAAGWVVAEQGVVLTDPAGYELRADELDYFPLVGTAKAVGAVEFSGPDGTTLQAGAIDFDVRAEVLRIGDGLRYEDPAGYVIEAAGMEYDLAAREGFAVAVTLLAPDTTGAVTAGRVELSPARYALEDASFTSCMPDDPDWLLTARAISVEDGTLQAEGAVLRVLDLPVMYLPSLSTKLVKQRRSGFLAPEVVVHSGGETSIEQPFYLNFAPNYDAIASARFINGGGVYGRLNGRWLFADAAGTAEIGGIHDERGEVLRGNYSLREGRGLGRGLRLTLAADWLSDDDFADDFFIGDATARRHYAKEARLYYDDGRDSYGLAVVDYQTIQEEDGVVERPYGSLPRLWLGTRRQAWEGRTSFDYFTRGEDDPREGFRLHSDVAVNGRAWVGLNSVDARLGVANSVYEHEDLNWTVPYAELRLRRKYQGAFELGDAGYAQLLEPSLFLGLVRQEDFSDVPLYDTKAAEFSAQDLYQVNSYIGGDRFEDANLLAYGLSTYVWQRAGRREFLEAHVAQRYRFEDSKVVTTADDPPPDAGFSNVVVEGSLYPNEANALRSRFEWDPDADALGQVAVAYQHRAPAGDSYAMRYVRNADEAQDNDDGQASVGAYRSFGANWRVTGDVTYDIEESQMSRLLGGMRFLSSCRCWSADFYVEREPLAERDRTTYFVQMNLMGLGGFGEGRFDRAAAKIRERI